MMIGGIFAITIGALASWTALDWPRPAFTFHVDRVERELNTTEQELKHDIAELREFSTGTRKLTLNNDWFRLMTQLRGVNARLAPGISRPGPEARATLEELKFNLETQIHEVETQLKALK